MYFNSCENKSSLSASNKMSCQSLLDFTKLHAANVQYLIQVNTFIFKQNHQFKVKHNQQQNSSYPFPPLTTKYQVDQNLSRSGLLAQDRLMQANTLAAVLLIALSTDRKVIINKIKSHQTLMLSSERAHDLHTYQTTAAWFLILKMNSCVYSFTSTRVTK